MYQHKMTYLWLQGHDETAPSIQSHFDEMSADGWEMVSSSMHGFNCYLFWKRHQDVWEDVPTLQNVNTTESGEINWDDVESVENNAGSTGYNVPQIQKRSDDLLN